MQHADSDYSVSPEDSATAAPIVLQWPLRQQ